MSLPALENKDFNLPVHILDNENIQYGILYTTELDKLFVTSQIGSHLILISNGISVYSFEHKYISLELETKTYFILLDVPIPNYENISTLANSFLLRKLIFQEIKLVSLHPIDLVKHFDYCTQLINEHLQVIKNECQRLEDNIVLINRGMTEAKKDFEVSSIKSVKDQYEHHYNTEISNSFNNYVLPLQEILKRLHELKLYAEKFNTSSFESGDPFITLDVSPRNKNETIKFISIYSPYKIIYLYKNGK